MGSTTVTDTPRLARSVLLAVFVAACSSSGCMTVTFYQPMKAIHRPVLVEPTSTTFAGLKILVRCLAHTEHMPSGDAAKLCGRIAADLERQGAETAWVAPSGAQFVDPPVFDGEKPDLTIEIESSIDHAYDYPLSTVAWCCTCTMVPSLEEQTFSQHVVVLGRDRSVLTEEVFRERFVEYNGCGIWSLNYLIDWLIRAKEDAVSGDVAKRDFSRDFYGQVRQLAFNARVRSELLGLTAPRARAPFMAEPSPPSAGSASTTTTPSGTPADAATTKEATAPSGTPSAPAAPSPTTSGASSDVGDPDDLEEK